MIQRKLMLLGEIGVGKTSTIRRLVFDKFETNYKATVGTDIYTVDVEPQPGIDQPLGAEIEHHQVALDHVLHEQGLGILREHHALGPASDRRLGLADQFGSVDPEDDQLARGGRERRGRRAVRCRRPASGGPCSCR